MDPGSNKQMTASDFSEDVPPRENLFVAPRLGIPGHQGPLWLQTYPSSHGARTSVQRLWAPGLFLSLWLHIAAVQEEGSRGILILNQGVTLREGD